MLRYLDTPTRVTLTMQETANNGFITHSNGISEAKKRHLLGPSNFSVLKSKSLLKTINMTDV